jgi:hypothetical protein
MRRILLVLLIILNLKLFGQYSNILPSSASIASTSTADIAEWTAYNTPATLAYLDHCQIAVHYDNRYSLSQLATKSVQLAMPSQLMHVGASLSYFGYSLYHEMAFGGTVARDFGDKFAIGLQANYLNSYFSNTNTSLGVFFIQVGVNTKLTPKFSLAFHSLNPTQSNIKTEYSEKIIPSLFSLGTSYEINPQFTWRTQIDREIHTHYRFATGMDYQIVKELKLKIGAYATDYFVPCLGLKIALTNVAIHLNTELHPLLGLNSSVGLKYNFSHQ